MPEQLRPSKRSQSALDWLNFFMADVETAFGPFVAVFLSQRGWAASEIGIVLAVNSAVGLITEIPAGWLIDWIRLKWLVVAGCLGFILAGALLIAFFPVFLPVVAAEIMHGVTSGTLRTAIASIALGLVGHRVLHTRIGRNHRYQSIGNAMTAVTMGVLGHFASPRSPFFAAAGLCLPAFVALAGVQHKEIDPARARQSGADGACKSWRELWSSRSLLVFAGVLFLFQFANASLLPLSTERLTSQHAGSSELVTSAMVAVPQLVTAGLAAMLARWADEIGRKPLLIVALAALTLRAALFALDLSPWLMISVQMLGGLTAAVLGILTPLIVADLTRGSGRYNLALGGVSMLAGLGATVSTPSSGFIAQSAGPAMAFVILAAVAALAGAVVWLLLPETVHESRSES